MNNSQRKEPAFKGIDGSKTRSAEAERTLLVRERTGFCDQIPLKSRRLVMLTAGGTGGHVYPAESLAEELIKRGYDVAFITDKRGKENGKGKLGEITNYAVLSGALVGKSKLFKIKSLIKNSLGILQAITILLKKKPLCVVGFGGYASFPCCVAATILGVKLVIHEQNSVMSRTNRFLSKRATLIAQSFKNVKYTPANIKSVLTGMPIRKAIIEVKNKPDSNTFQILVLGGSQGAKIFSDIIPEALKTLDTKTQEKITIIQQCREADLESLKKSYEGLKTKTTLASFFNNMPELYEKSSIIISRAGASSVCEILATGIPSILVPLPIAADDHQTFNAKNVEDANSGIIIKQQDFTTQKVSAIIQELMGDKEKLQTMSDNAKKAGITDAASRLADAIEKEVIC